MIEVLLQAERALTAGMVDQAERLYQGAVEADPRNSIAVVGLARVAIERGDDAAALSLARRALAIDPDNAAAQRLERRLLEVLAFRAEPVTGKPVTGEPATDAGAPSGPATAGRRRGLLSRIIRRGG